MLSVAASIHHFTWCIILFYRMSRFDVKNYLESIYKIDISKVNIRIQTGESAFCIYVSLQLPVVL